VNWGINVTCMQTLSHQAGQRGRGGRRPKLLAGVAALTAGALVSALTLTAGPAYADVTSSYYTIGTPSGAVSDLVASPGSVTKGQSTNFQVSFTVGNALAGSSDDWVSLAVNGLALGSVPANVDLVGSSCIQSGTNGGSDTTSLVTVELQSSCSIAAGSNVDLDFSAAAPTSVGSFTFGLSTSRNTTAATSNTITVNSSGISLAAGTYGLGANTTYTIGGVTLAGSTSSLVLDAVATAGSDTITFLSSLNGSGYSVNYTPSGGSTASDTVTSASASGATVTLNLASSLASGDTLTITATGTNPAASASNEITVTPPAEATESVAFGGSVTGLAASPSSSIAGASTTYTVSFEASDGVSAGGTISLTESSGPTNFTTVSGIEVIDNTQNWHFVASGPVLASGSATITLLDTINAHDSITVILVGVTNPPNTGPVSDFAVSTSSDPVPTDAATYTIGANASPGVIVTVNPASTGAIATYTISNVHATATLAGGAGTVELEGPDGTVFPNSPSSYSIADSTTSSGSGTVTTGLTGGGTSTVTLTVPNTVNSGDVISLTIANVINPPSSSSTDTITLVGNVTGPTPTAPTTTTTIPTTTTTRPKPKPKPAVTDLTSSAKVTKGVVYLKFRCSTLACKGTVTLLDVVTKIAGADYHADAGKTFTVHLGVNKTGMRYLKGAKKHTIKGWAEVTVKGGTSIKDRLVLTLG